MGAPSWTVLKELFIHTLFSPSLYTYTLLVHITVVDRDHNVISTVLHRVDRADS